MKTCEELVSPFIIKVTVVDVAALRAPLEVLLKQPPENVFIRKKNWFQISLPLLLWWAVIVAQLRITPAGAWRNLPRADSILQKEKKKEETPQLQHTREEGKEEEARTTGNPPVLASLAPDC